MNTIEQNIISHQIWLQRLATQTSSLSIPFINKMREEVREATLSFGDDARTVKKLNKLMDSLNGVLEDVTGDWKKTIEKELRSIADYENKWFKHTLESGVRKDLRSHILAPTAEELWSAIKFTPMSTGSQPVGLIDALDGWTISEKNRLVRGVQSGFIQGQTTRQIVKNVVGAGGLADVSERGATAIVRTAVNHVSTQAKIEVGKANEDIVSGYEIVITLDSRTSAICRNLPHGKVYEFGKGPMPPLHYNCRDTIVPKIEDDFLDFLDEGAVRAARGADGGMQVDANTSYYDFLKSQPAWFQDEALGPVRGAIFRNSGLTPDEFRSISIDGFNRPMTIQQMAEMDSRVAEYLSKSKGFKSIPNGSAASLSVVDKEFMEKSSPIKSIKQEKEMIPPKPDSMVTIPDAPQRIVSAPEVRKLTSEQIGAVEYYKGDGFYNDNIVLRNPEMYTKSEVTQAKNNARRINAAIDTSVTSKDHYFYRGIRSSELFDAAEDLVGKDIINRTVQSTTYAKGVADSYAGLIAGYSAEPGASVVLKINAPKGSKALNVSNLTNINSSEKEILLKAGSRYRVTKVTNHGQYKEIEVDYVEGDGEI